MHSWWTSEPWRAYEAACGDGRCRERELREATWNTRVLDLRPSEEALWRGVRRSYHALVNRLTNDSGLRIVSTADVVDSCLEIHSSQAGRQTRPVETWLMQEQWVRDGLADCYVASRWVDAGLGDVVVGFAYVLTVGVWAYYFSAASCEPNVAHALQWHAIRELKAQGLTRYELGWQGQASDEKGQAIEFFRRGFGGEDVPAARGGDLWAS